MSRSGSKSLCQQRIWNERSSGNTARPKMAGDGSQEAASDSVRQPSAWSEGASSEDETNCCLKRGRRRSGQRKAKAASCSCSPRTLYPHASSHRFCELLTQIETQASSRHGPGKIALEPHKFFKEQGKFIRGNTRPSIFDTDLHLWRRLIRVSRQ